MKFASKTKKLMDEHSARGYSIIIGNNPHMHNTEKWKNHDLILLARTNARTHGYCIRTVWATKKMKGETT
tara:strand:+ start:76 stop:285 length:210 start_codon:yes stop_codon:yes gene_type:complete